jgi:signal transduction histidine kinase
MIPGNGIGAHSLKVFADFCGLRSIAMDNSQDIACAVAAIGRIAAVPTLLKVLCEMTGLRFAAVAHVEDATWTAYAVRDDLSLGIQAGDELAFMRSLGIDARAACRPILFDQPQVAPTREGATLCSIKSFVSVPIIMGSGRHFGTLCALDSNPASLREPRILSMFKDFAALIATQLDQHSSHERERSALLDERATNELREQFIAILGHDLRNPLHAVFAGGELLERRLTDPTQRMIASRIKTYARRMSSLINDVLDFARGRLGGGIGLELADVDNITDGLTSVIEELQVAQPDCRILSHIDVSRSVPCDLGRLQQVASNLLGNALTHGKRGSPIKFIATTDVHDLVLEVWNEGEPIPPESIGKIFEPFWRNSVSPNRNGLGLGLHICWQIVHAHQGQITVTSSAEHGTQFTVRLPLSTLVRLSIATVPDTAQDLIFSPPPAAAGLSGESTSASP